MRIVSFAWTTPPLLAGAKCCTRRDWAVRTREAIHAGDQCLAYDRNPRIGGIPVAVVEITESPYLQRMGKAPESDYAREGFAWLDAHPDIRRRAMPKIAKEMRTPVALLGDISMRDFWDLWREQRMQELTVVRFRLLEVRMSLEQWLDERATKVLGAAA